VSQRTVLSHMPFALSISTRRPMEVSRLWPMLHSEPRSLVTSFPIGDVQSTPAHASAEALPGGFSTGAWTS
jgi:hypothetical protein